MQCDCRAKDRHSCRQAAWTPSRQIPLHLWTWCSPHPRIPQFSSYADTGLTAAAPDLCTDRRIRSAYPERCIYPLQTLLYSVWMPPQPLQRSDPAVRLAFAHIRHRQNPLSSVGFAQERLGHCWLPAVHKRRSASSPCPSDNTACSCPHRFQCEWPDYPAAHSEQTWLHPVGLRPEHHLSDEYRFRPHRQSLWHCPVRQRQCK